MSRASTPAIPFAVAVALAALLLSSGCRPPGKTADGAAAAGVAPLSAADIAAIHATDTAFSAAANAGDGAGVAALYAPDAHLLPPNAPTVEGREAIGKFWDGLLGAYRVQITVTADQIEGYGDLAYARGHYSMDLTPKKGGAVAHEDGKFLEILRRQPDGSWRYAVDMFSSDQPPPK